VRVGRDEMVFASLHGKRHVDAAVRWLLPWQSKQKPKSEEANVRSSPSHKSRLAGLKRAEPRALSFGSPLGTKRIFELLPSLTMTRGQ
jgi:hypothetical protein